MSNGKQGGQPGNQNAANARLWRAALERATQRLATGATTDPNDDRSDLIKGLDLLADNYVQRLPKCDDKFAAGLFGQYADRFDGRAAQSISVGGDPDGVPLKTEVVVNFPEKKE